MVLREGSIRDWETLIQRRTTRPQTPCECSPISVPTAILPRVRSPCIVRLCAAHFFESSTHHTQSPFTPSKTRPITPSKFELAPSPFCRIQCRHSPRGTPVRYPQPLPLGLEEGDREQTLLLNPRGCLRRGKLGCGFAAFRSVRL
jgi:hypothetical protein